MVENLEIKCFNCDDVVNLEVPTYVYEHYMLSGFLPQNSEAARELFDGHGWVLQQSPFCWICKYTHSEVYQD